MLYFTLYLKHSQSILSDKIENTCRKFSNMLFSYFKPVARRLGYFLRRIVIITACTQKHSIIYNIINTCCSALRASNFDNLGANLPKLLEHASRSVPVRVYTAPRAIVAFILASRYEASGRMVVR